ncbi:MAG: HAMP domain-containing sensor histidine kinase [Oscillospiraceae bacterium]|nr:HAMP domain-containing sensor histidine kinase [Oscillospiraceae bacterium]
MKRLLGISTFINSVQLKFALTFLVLIAGLMMMLNTYPTIVSRDLVFAAKQNSLQTQANVMSSALSASDELTGDTVQEVMSFLDLRSLTRVIVTDDSARILYDTAELGSGVGGFALFSEIGRALDGKIVCYSVYDGKAFMSREAMPIKNDGVTIGAVYLYEYDSTQAQLITGIQKNLRNITLVLGAAAVILMFIFSRALTLRITELVRATRIVSEGDYDHRINAVGKDELSELGREFNSLTQRLKDTEELRRRFVSDASHELKTPLASIRLLSDSIVNSQDMDIGTMREFVTDIGNEAERLSRTTEKLLSLTKMDSGIGMSQDRLDLRRVVEKTMHLLSPLAKEYRVTISTELQHNCFILGSEDLVYRIIFNLAENSIKYNMPGGTVRILLFREAENVVLVVEDSGIGIPDEDLPHIFSRFYRVDKARSRDAGGSGLGLSIVFDAVRLHGGSIRVEKREVGGTRFIVEFPACPDEKNEHGKVEQV